MAKIGEIDLDKNKFENNNQINCAVAFFLSSESPLSNEYKTPINGTIWNVELLEGQNSIVGRCSEILTKEDILNYGLAGCQHVLDILSAIMKTNLGIVDPDKKHIFLYRENAKRVLRVTDNVGLNLSFGVNITVTDKEGKIKEQPQKPLPKWISAFQYYRRSQLASDIFEAYRNLFLSFESLLSEYCPKNNREREKDWIIRVLNMIDMQISLENSIGRNILGNVGEYVYQRQYEDVRLRLFHSKDQIILPYDSNERQFVAERYTELIKIWRTIADEFFDCQSDRGVITKDGMRLLLGNISKDINFKITSDLSPESKEDIEISPNGEPIIDLDNTHCELNDEGIAIFSGRINKNQIKKFDQIGRIGLFSNDNLLTINRIDNGLTVDGIDIFESYQILALFDKKTPKFLK